MELFGILCCIAVGLLGLLFLLLLLCFFLVFYIPTRHPERDPYPVPRGKAYEPYHEKMREWLRQTDTMPRESVSITSFDGLTLRGQYFEHAPGAPIELMFPGYRGSARRDLAGGVIRRLALGHNVILIDQRAGGESDGHITTFGIRESQDCVAWAEFAAHRFGPDCKLILTGISMGAATVLMASAQPLPPQVVGVLADCGYTSARDIMHHVMRQIHLPPALLYPMVRMAGKLFGGFDVEDASPIRAMAHCQVPVIFYHGEGDAFVPCQMSRENYAACVTPKRIYTVPGAEHGLSYPADPQGYLTELRRMYPLWGLDNTLPHT